MPRVSERQRRVYLGLGGVLARHVDELATWRVATFVVVMLAVVVFCVQRFVTQVFDVAFEVCIFHVPAVVIVIYVFICLGRERKGC